MSPIECHSELTAHQARCAAREAEIQALAEWKKQGKEKKPAAVG
jgi:hypothetical protein